MPIIFKSEKTLKFFLDNGFVYTLRPYKRKKQFDWVTNKMFGEKIAKAYIVLIGLVVKRDGEYWVTGETIVDTPLKFFAKWSGFKDEKEWVEEVRKLNKKVPSIMYLYRVSKLGD